MTKVVFFGNERLSTGVTATAAPTLKALIANGYEVVAVVAHHEEARSRKPRPLEVEAIASEHSIPVFLPDKPSEIIDALRELDADIGVLVAYGRIISQAVIDLFPHGVINLHPSLLPQYRGPIPIEQAILDSASETGVSIMRLQKEMDAGPIYIQEKVTLTGHETKFELTNRLLELGSELIIKALPGVLDGTLEPKPQDESKATFCSLIEKADGRIDWNKPATQIEREIRAFQGWPGSYTSLYNRDVIITKAHSIPVNHPDSKPGDVTVAAGEIMIECGAGTLCIDRLKPAGKGEMDGTAFLNGVR